MRTIINILLFVSTIAFVSCGSSTADEPQSETKVKVMAVTLSEASVELIVGNSVQLTATVTPDDATDKAVTWSSSNSNVADVTDGLVTAKAPGTATITAYAGGKSATCIVTVRDEGSVNPQIEVMAVTLSEASVELIVGNSVQLTATVTPDDATDKAVTWSSSNSNVADVTDGLVTAKAPGTATITAYAGGKSATCIVTVRDEGSVNAGIEGWGNGENYEDTLD